MKAKCTTCGKEYEIQDGTPSAKFVQEHPERAKCFDCFKAGGTDKAAATKKATTAKAPAAAKATINAEVLRQSYDEVVAAFADVLDDVKDYLGGWTTTVALSKK